MTHETFLLLIQGAAALALVLLLVLRVGDGPDDE